MLIIIDDVVGNSTFETDCLDILESNKKNTNEINFYEKWCEGDPIGSIDIELGKCFQYKDADWLKCEDNPILAPGPVAVSYTHLTLPTICSV